METTDLVGSLVSDHADPVGSNEEVEQTSE
jgi:hypothetical protein